MKIDIINNEIIIQPCSPKKLAALYGVSTKVLRTWLRPYPSLHEKRNRVYNLKQLFEIIELIGLPAQPWFVSEIEDAPMPALHSQCFHASERGKEICIIKL
jgi:hypothetical protein